MTPAISDSKSFVDDVKKLQTNVSHPLDELSPDEVGVIPTGFSTAESLIASPLNFRSPVSRKQFENTSQELISRPPSSSQLLSFRLRREMF